MVQHFADSFNNYCRGIGFDIAHGATIGSFIYWLNKDYKTINQVVLLNRCGKEDLAKIVENLNIIRTIRNISAHANNQCNQIDITRLSQTTSEILTMINYLLERKKFGLSQS